jgi:hypothetical protein
MHAMTHVLPSHPERSAKGAKPRDLFYVICILCLCIASACAQTTPAEQAETGQVQTRQGMRTYRIRLLPVESFPNLPAAVAGQLNAQHCMIPQTFEARKPENVIHGEFEAAGSADWAVLCSHDGSTSLLVFFHDMPEKPSTLTTVKDTDRMASELPSDDLGSAWGISTIPPDGMKHTPGVHQHGPFNHDGIEDDYIEHASTVHYYKSGSWLALEGNN